jgi:hypothetical protein
MMKKEAKFFSVNQIILRALLKELADLTVFSTVKGACLFNGDLIVHQHDIYIIKMVSLE